MGIARNIADAIVREHRHRPISGDVVVIGRQTIYLSPSGAVDLVRSHGVVPATENPAIDHRTLNRSPDFNGVDLVSDAGFFALLGVENCRALDRTAYEGAEIIHDLSEPLPERLRETADLVVDGSTLDNTFNPARTLRTYAELLRPGGRLIATDSWSTNTDPYVACSPFWFLDYFVANRFVDCKVYVLAYLRDHTINAFVLDPMQVFDPRRELRAFSLAREMATFVIAEKGPNSTVDRVPIQGAYRSAEDWLAYRRDFAAFALAHRSHIVCSTGPLGIRQPPPGYLYVNQRCQAMECDVASQMQNGLPAAAKSAIRAVAPGIGIGRVVKRLVRAAATLRPRAEQDF